MLTVPGSCIGLVHHLVAVWRQDLRLAFLGPQAKALGQLVIEAPHLLQAHDIGIQGGQGAGHVVNL